MNEVINYIFGSLRTSEVVMHNIAKELRQQRRFNRNIAVIAGMAVYFAVNAEMERRRQAEKIKNLEREIKELKRSEGE